MKRVACLLLSLTLLAACGAQTPAPPTELPVKVQQPVPPLPAPAEEPQPPEPPVWEGSEPQQGEPIVPQPGDTASSWDPDRAKDFPADDDCTDDQLLAKWLAVEGLSSDDPLLEGCGQLILTAASGKEDAGALITCYTRQSDGSWLAEKGMTRMAGFTGSKGIRHSRQRNTKTSPAGLWGLGSAFGSAEQPQGLKLPWRDITPQSDWVCDAESPYFNTWQERDDPTLTSGWNLNDVEHLEDYATYAYACVICFNTPPHTVPERGCAIFLHCSDHPTTGCIGLLEEDMVRTLLWLDPTQNPVILISGVEME